MSCKDVGVEIRPANNVALVAAAWLLLALLGAAQAYVRGASALRLVVLLIGLGYLAWRVLGRPKARLDEHGLTAVNPFDQVTIPWTAVIDMDVKFGLRVITPHGRHSVWGATGRGNFARTATASDAERARKHWQTLVEADRIEAGIADEVPVVRTWDLTAIVACVALLAGGLAIALV